MGGLSVARRWYNPMHVAKQKPHETRAAAAARPAPSAPSASASAPAVPAAAWPPTEARTLGDLIKMQQSGLPAMLPPSFLEHARAVRTYDGSAAKVRATTETPPSLSAQPRESAPAPDFFEMSGSASAAASIVAALAGSARQPPSQAQSRRNSINSNEQLRQRGPTAPSSALSRVASFDLRPRELVALLDRYVVRQSEVSSRATARHYST
jgi:hypothetical protein